MVIPSTFAQLPYCSDLSRIPSGIAILGAEHGTPYGTGSASHTAGSPAALRSAIKGYGAIAGQYDFDTHQLVVRDAVDCGDIAGTASDPAGNRGRIVETIGAVLARDAVPVVLGGDDSIPIPVLQAYQDAGPLTVVQVDAHLDWRDEVAGERYGYSSTMRRVSEMPWVEEIVQVGMRGVGSARADDVAAAKAWGARIFTAREIHSSGLVPVLDAIAAGARCFVTVDCDGLDPSIMPAVIAPAPGGLGYWHVIGLLQGLAAKARIVGFDIVEYVPSRDPTGLAALTAAKITANAIAAIASSRASR